MSSHKVSLSVGVLIALAVSFNCGGGEKPTQTQPILIADSQQGDDPHGPDPHDEIHDKALPSNQAAKDREPPKDVYGGHELDERKAQQKRDDDRFAAEPRRN